MKQGEDISYQHNSLPVSDRAEITMQRSLVCVSSIIFSSRLRIQISAFYRIQRVYLWHWLFHNWIPTVTEEKVTTFHLVISPLSYKYDRNIFGVFFSFLLSWIRPKVTRVKTNMAFWLVVTSRLRFPLTSHIRWIGCILFPCL